MEGSSGAGSGISRKKPSLQTFQSAIRWVFNMGIGTNIDDFVWKPIEKETVVYRGQCSSSTKAIERRGTNPLAILTNLEPPKPISTSKLLSEKILEFSCPLDKKASGRLFELHLMPGVLITSMYDQIPEEFQLSHTKNQKTLKANKEALTPLIKEAFQFLTEELPETHRYKKASVNQLYGLFFNLLHKEKEILLDPRKIKFIQEDKTPESWSNPETSATLYAITKRGDKVKNESGEFQTLGEISVYRTIVVPKSMLGGKRRRKTRRRRIHTKNGQTM